VEFGFMPRPWIYLLVFLLALNSFAANAATPVKKSATVTTKPASLTAAVIPLLKQGAAALEQGQSAQAESAFKQALTRMGPADPNRLVAYDGLAKLYFKQDRYTQALPYAQKALPLMKARYGATSIQAAGALYLVANIQHHLGDLSNAEAGYRQAIVLYEAPANMGQPSVSYPAALQNMGAIAGQRHQFDAALTWYQKALVVQQRKPDQDLGAVLENVGISYQNLGKAEEARNFYQQALANYEKYLGAQSPEAKRVYFKLANLGSSNTQPTASESTPNPERYNGQYYEAGKRAYNETKDYPEAARQFKLALEQALKYYPQEARFIASLQATLGKALYYAESDEAATPYLEQALLYQTAHLPAQDDEVLNTQLHLGMAYNRQGDYEQAEKYLNAVLAHAAPSSDYYRANLPVLADNQCHQGRFEEGKRLYEQALTLYERQPTPNPEHIKSIKYQLALLEKMFQAHDVEQYLNYKVTGLHRWNDQNQAIQILLTSGDGLPGWNPQNLTLVQKAFQEWQQALGNRVRFQFTTDPDKSDVVVNWTDRPLAQTDLDAQVGVHKLESVRGFFARSEIVLALAKEGKVRTDTQLYAAALHEIGHLLGLDHSNNLADIMAAVGNYALPAKGMPTLTANDIRSAQSLYQQKPAITNPTGITLAEYRQFDAVAKEGIEAFKRRDYRQAYRRFEDARALYAQDPYINFYDGISAFQKGDYKAAREIFESLVMPESTRVFSVDSQLGLVYVELGHKYNRFGRKNKQLSTEFYDKGVLHLRRALQNPEVAYAQREYLLEKLREGETRRKPEPVFSFELVGPGMRYY
jgi:tetratricopeptide (TPR) repeat protein